MAAHVQGQRGAGSIRTMKQQEWFVVGIRLIGVWLLFLGIEELVTLVEARFGLISPLHTGLGAYFFHAAVDFAVGAYFLAGGGALVSFAFGGRAPIDPASNEAAPNDQPES
jgi:hypothetical protein